MPPLSTGEASADKRCTVQRFPVGPPSPEWSREQLLAYVEVQHQVILDNERLLALNYWRLGKALEVLRKTFGHGQWEQFLKGRISTSRRFPVPGPSPGRLTTRRISRD
jgi:hypothetical protein